MCATVLSMCVCVRLYVRVCVCAKGIHIEKAKHPAGVAQTHTKVFA